MKKLTRIVVILVILVYFVLSTACEREEIPLVGRWLSASGVIFEFDIGGEMSVIFDGVYTDGRWAVRGERLIMQLDGEHDVASHRVEGELLIIAPFGHLDDPETPMQNFRRIE